MVLKKSYAQFTDDSIGNTIHSNSDRKAETRGWIQSNGFPSIKKCLYRTCSKIWCYRGSEDLIQIVINDNGQCTVKWIKRLERVSEWKQAQPSNASWQCQSVQWISRWRWFWRIWEGTRPDTRPIRSRCWWAGAVMRVGRGSSWVGGGCILNLGRSCDGQKSVFQSISRHQNFRVPDRQTDLPTKGHILLKSRLGSD